jgi:hypothetical protein
MPALNYAQVTREANLPMQLVECSSFQMALKPNFSPEQIMALVEATITEAPAFPYEGSLSDDDLRWLGKAETLIEAAGSTNDLLEFRLARKFLHTMQHSRNDLLVPLHNTFYRAELLAPPSSRGAFIPSGETWNGYAAIVRLIQQPSSDLIIVDPYLNADLFLEFAPHGQHGQKIRCLANKRKENHSGLVAAALRWEKDHPNGDHQVEVRYAPQKSLHDRLIIIDGAEAWLVSQSFKDIAKKSPASVAKADTDLAKLKAEHYNHLWDESEPLDQSGA